MAGPFVDVRFDGGQHIPTTGRVVVACNHPPMLNTLIPWAVMDRNPAVLVISHAFTLPGLGGILRTLGNVPVRRDGLRWGRRRRDHRLDRATSAKAAVDVLDHDGVVQLYPEGKIARGWPRTSDVLQDLAPGVARIARTTGSPTVPFGIRLGWRFSRRGLKHIITINIGPPVQTVRSSDDAELVRQVREALGHLSGLPRQQGTFG